MERDATIRVLVYCLNDTAKALGEIADRTADEWTYSRAHECLDTVLSVVAQSALEILVEFAQAEPSDD